MTNDSEIPTPLVVDLRPVLPGNIDELRALNAAIFPVRYNDKFYEEALKSPEELARLAYVDGVLVGSVCCRKETYAAQADGAVASDGGSRHQTENSVRDSPATRTASSAPYTHKLYIMTLGVLAPYRELGVGRKLLEYVLHSACHSPAAAGITEVYLHVQVGNESALSFYRRYGFVVKGRIENYYRKIEPVDCFYISKDMVLDDGLTPAESCLNTTEP